MATPSFLSDSQGERVDTIIDSAGSTYYKAAIGSNAAGGNGPTAGQLIGTHKPSVATAATDPFVATMGTVWGAVGSNTAPIAVEPTGRQIVVGIAGGTPVPISGAALPAALGGGGGLKVEGVGTAGTPAGGVVTVQGIIGGLPFGVAGNSEAVPADAGHAGIMMPTDRGATASGPLGVATYIYAGNGASPVLTRTPAVFHSAVATAAGNTAVWTPTSGKKFRLMRFMIVLTDEAARAAAGDITVKFQDATTDIGIGLPVYVPAAAIAAPIGEAWSSGWIDLGNGILSAAANNVLNVNLSAALTAGTFGVIVAGTEE